VFRRTPTVQVWGARISSSRIYRGSRGSRGRSATLSWIPLLREHAALVAAHRHACGTASYPSPLATGTSSRPASSLHNGGSTGPPAAAITRRRTPLCSRSAPTRFLRSGHPRTRRVTDNALPALRDLELSWVKGCIGLNLHFTRRFGRVAWLPRPLDILGRQLDTGLAAMRGRVRFQY
jgi:hypothetical protein